MQGLVFREPKGSFFKMGCGVRPFTGHEPQSLGR